MESLMARVTEGKETFLGSRTLTLREESRSKEEEYMPGAMEDPSGQVFHRKEWEICESARDGAHEHSM